MLKILFLCTGNSCRSQMAEGWARHLKGGMLQAWSAGIEAQGLNPFAIRAMAEAGVDISRQRSTNLSEYSDMEFDYVFTVCAHANGQCPVFPGAARVIHVPFDDPPVLAQNAKSDEDAMAHYRRVRDEIKGFVNRLPESIGDF